MFSENICQWVRAVRIILTLFPQVGNSIPWSALDFPSLESLLRSLPEVCSLEGRTVLGVASRETRHVQEMVARQNNKKVGGRRAGGGGGGHGGGG